MGEYSRRMNIKITVDVWEWVNGTKTGTYDMTTTILSYRFQKTIKNPTGSCQFSVVPQIENINIMDELSTMDVIKIYEFGVLKFIGYIIRISYGGSIGNDGKPSRNTTITCQQMGGLLQTASIGLGLCAASGIETDSLLNAAALLSLNLANAAEDGLSFAEMIGVLVNGFIDYIESIGAENLSNYLSEYIDASTGLCSDEITRLPKTFALFNGTEQSVTFWQVAEQLVERPFNELWIDNGPRIVSVGGKTVELINKVSIVFRPTPFNGRLIDGNEGTEFDSLPVVNVDKNHLISFNLSKSMDEAYSFYSVKKAAFRMDDVRRLLLGQAKIDSERIGKYLLKPLMTELFFTRIENVNGDDIDPDATASKLETEGLEEATTLYNWYHLNDKYLSGVITEMVPKKAENDPKIGQKLSVYGIEGYFYVEGIAHTWSYQGPLKTDLTVTRGYDYNHNKPIKLKDKIFSRNAIR